MASWSRSPPIREPSVFDNSRNISSVLSETARETRVQTYCQPGDPDSSNDERETTKNGSGYTLVVRHHDAPNQSQQPSPTSPRNFIDWMRFDEATLPPRESLGKARRDKIFAPLNHFKVELPGDISLEGFGGIVESAHSVIHSHAHLDFMESERDILLPPLESSPDKLSQRELERLEVELFDLTKYNGYCEFLTAVAWAEEAESGSVTLYKVNMGPHGDALGIQPVAAMQGVPKSILVSMRTHDKIKRKAVFVPTDEDAQAFKWKANPSRGPTYVKLEASVSAQPTARLSSHSRERSSSRDHHGSSQVDAHGIKATIPQFVALMHADRSILEQIQTTHISLLNTGDGHVMPAVTLVKAPRPNSHPGDGVHVAVLMPNEAEWADEHIYWIDDEGLTEFRRRKYWDLIERGSRASLADFGFSWNLTKSHIAIPLYAEVSVLSTMLSLVHLTLLALLLVPGALAATANSLKSASDSSDFSESPSSQFESASGSFSSSQSFTSAGDGVDQASAFSILPQSSSHSDDGSDRASSTTPPDSSITSSLPVSTEPLSNPPLESADSTISSLFSQSPTSVGDGIDHASAITISPPTTSTADGIDRAPATTLPRPSTSPPPDGIDRASAVTHPPKTPSSSTSTSKKFTSTSTLFVTPPPVSTTVTVPPPFSNSSSPSRTASTTAAPDPSPTGRIGNGAPRFCPWCHPSIPVSQDKGECNFVMQQMQKGERLPWAILNSDFSAMLDGGLAAWNTAVVVSLSGGGKDGVGKVQMSGNRFWVRGSEGEEMGPHLVYNELDMPPTHHGWREYTFAAPGQEEGAGNVTVRRISFDCSQAVTCEFGGSCYEEL